MPYLFLWEDPSGNRNWEVIKKSQTHDFLANLLENKHVNPATIITVGGFGPNWLFKQFHNNSSDVSLNRLNNEIYGCDTTPVVKHKPVEFKEHPNDSISKYGWLAPDGRFFRCDYGGHSTLAQSIVGKIAPVEDAEQHLENLGWAKILKGFTANERYAIGMGVDKKLTDEQLKTLQREGLDNAFNITTYL